MKIPSLAAVSIILFATLAAAQQSTVDHYSAADIQQIARDLQTQAAQKPDGVATHIFQKYKNHFAELAFRRASGQVELHQHFADIFFVLEGDARLVTGGTILNPKSTGEGETRGSSIESGKEQTLGKGDLVHIPANTPHQLLLQPGSTFTYLVVKVEEQ